MSCAPTQPSILPQSVPTRSGAVRLYYRNSHARMSHRPQYQQRALSDALLQCSRCARQHSAEQPNFQEPSRHDLVHAYSAVRQLHETRLDQQQPSLDLQMLHCQPQELLPMRLPRMWSVLFAVGHVNAREKWACRVLCCLMLGVLSSKRANSPTRAGQQPYHHWYRLHICIF